MIVLSHRGYWVSPREKNTEMAFHHSFDSGYGTETDLRDCLGQLVMSHDMPNGSEVRLEQFLNILNGRNLPLAINIKSDGMALLLKNIFNHYQVADWFVFDMSIPDTRAQLQAGNPVFVRMSEVEQHPAWLEQAAGVWLDGFDSVWYNAKIIEGLLEKNKRVCVVSEDLHSRPHKSQWEMLSKITSPDLMLCTDHPEQASKFFLGEWK